MKKFLTLLLICYCANAFSQKIVFSQDVKSDTVRPTKGPNLKNYTHSYLGIGFPVFTNEKLNYIKPGVSMIVDFGFRYKRRLNNTFAIGADLSVNWAAYKIKEGADKSVPDSTENDKEKFKINSLSPALYARINIGRRGNSIGNYIDLGGYGSWNWKKGYKTTNKNEDDEMVNVYLTRLTYIEPISYGLLARVAVSRYALTARYRLSNIFKDDKYPELPRLSVGVEVGLLK
jgi:hypothetical protein